MSLLGCASFFSSFHLRRFGWGLGSFRTLTFVFAPAWLSLSLLLAQGSFKFCIRLRIQWNLWLCSFGRLILLLWLLKRLVSNCFTLSFLLIFSLVISFSLFARFTHLDQLIRALSLFLDNLVNIWLFFSLLLNCLGSANFVLLLQSDGIDAVCLDEVSV